MRFLFHLLLLFPLVVLGQNEKSTAVSVNTNDYQLAWADTIIPKIDRIQLVKIRPTCYDQKLRETILENATEIPAGCDQLSVVITDYEMIPEIDSVFMTEVVHQIDQKLLYQWTDIDTSIYDSITAISLGKRRSNIMDMCFSPRHAIVFKDAANDILGICEICFECRNVQLGFKTTDLIPMLYSDLNSLKKLFIEYGLIEN